MMKPFEYTSKAGKKSMIVDLKHMGMFEDVELLKKFEKTFEKKFAYTKNGVTKDIISFSTQVVMDGVDCYITFSPAQNKKWLEMPRGKVKLSLNEFDASQEDGTTRKQKVFEFESLEESNTIQINETVAVEANTAQTQPSMPSFGTTSALPVLDERKKAVYDHYKSNNLKPEDMIEWDEKPTMIKDIIGDWVSK